MSKVKNTPEEEIDVVETHVPESYEEFLETNPADCPVGRVQITHLYPTNNGYRVHVRANVPQQNVENGTRIESITGLDDVVEDDYNKNQDFTRKAILDQKIKTAKAELIGKLLPSNIVLQKIIYEKPGRDKFGRPLYHNNGVYSEIVVVQNTTLWERPATWKETLRACKNSTQPYEVTGTTSPKETTVDAF